MTNKQPVVGAGRITITKDMVLRQIMYHEFPLHKSVNGLDSLGLDEGPLKTYIDGLSDTQRQYILSYDERAQEDNRLIVFITKFTSTQSRKLMGADKCNPPANTRMESNASFAVFHCKKRTDPVLVCYTEEMCLSAYTDMPAWFQSRTKKVDASKVLKVCVFVPIPEHAWVPWNRFCDSKGKDIMPGSPAKDNMPNTMHGQINTEGCWMLFRNYNWPKDAFADFDKAFRELYRNQRYTAYKARLKDLHYNVNGEATRENELKALKWDENYAYTRFLRHIVGVNYFTRSDYHSLYNSDGKLFLPTKTPEYEAAVVPNKNAHDAEHAGFSKSRGGDYDVPDTLLVKNRMNFTPQKKWAPNRGDHVDAVADRSWGDVVLFSA